VKSAVICSFPGGEGVYGVAEIADFDPPPRTAWAKNAQQRTLA
jgi:hypothetical protein